MKKELLLTKSAVLWSNEYYLMDDYILLKVFRIDGTESYDVFIDVDDFDLVSKGQWYVVIGRKNSHLKDIIHVYYTVNKGGKKKCYDIYQWILGTKGKEAIVDHIDMNRLNNRKSNLRLVTASINRINQEYKCFYQRSENNFVTSISIDGTEVYSGSYTTKDEAIIKYLKACIICGRDINSKFIKDKISEYNVKLMDEDFEDQFLLKVKIVLNKEDISKLKSVKAHIYNNTNTERQKEDKASFKSKGYYYEKSTGKFLVRITINSKMVNIGRYPTEFEALTMYLKANLILGKEKLADRLKEMIEELDISITEEDYSNRYIKKVILLRDNKDIELPNELNGKCNLNYDKNMELIHKLYKEGYSYHGIAKYLKDNVEGLKNAKSDTVKIKHENYLKRINLAS